MKYVGIIMFAAGVILFCFAFTMDTSVEVNYSSGNKHGLPDRVNNIGLMADKQNYIILSLVLIVLGAITAVTFDAKPEKICPKCAEKVKRDAKICRFCSNEFV